MNHQKSKSTGTCRLWHQLWLLASISAPCLSQIGCVYRDQEGQSPPTPPNPPTVSVFDYRVSDVDSGATYTSGCGAAGSYNDLSVAIVVKIPLGTDYLLELTNGRAITGTVYTYDTEYFCAAPYESHALGHINPNCYRSPADSGSELIQSSVVDSAGNILTSGDAYVDGTNTDIVRFEMKALGPGQVMLTSDGPPCNGATSDITLLTIESP